MASIYGSGTCLAGIAVCFGLGTCCVSVALSHLLSRDGLT